MNNQTTPVTITLCPDGPLLVRGEFSIAQAPGRTPEQPDRQVVALCRCGKTGIAPLCDGSHKLTKFRAPAPQDSETAKHEGGKPVSKKTENTDHDGLNTVPEEARDDNAERPGTSSGSHEHEDELVDEWGDESFPSSDPPAHY